MTSISNIISSVAFRKQLERLERFKENPHKTQEALLFYLLKRASNTEWGKKYNYSKIETMEQYMNTVPVSTYEDMEPVFAEIMQGKQNILWDENIKWFAKSAGTTTGKSKYIPVSKDSLFNCHYAAGNAMVASYLNNRKDSRLLLGKNFSVSGSYVKENNSIDYYLVGDISAILMYNLPKWAEYIKTPSKKTTLISNWEEKINKIATIIKNKNIVSLLGVPSWMLVILRCIEEKSGKTIDELFPNLEVFFNGGVEFLPYRDRYNALITNNRMQYFAAYNASEGYFAFQDKPGEDDMLLLLDYGIYYEFIPLDKYSLDKHFALQLNEVKEGENYAVVISTNSGLWRYVIGDTVKFTSLNPYKIKITGRTKAFINVVGEELILDNANIAIEAACSKTNAILSDFTAAPKYHDNGRTSHEWLVEFEQMPENIDEFAKVLDENLMQQNSDYKAKRFNDMVLLPPIITIIPKGAIYEWFKSKNKLGGQNKFIRLSNNRNIIDEIISMQ